MCLLGISNAVAIDSVDFEQVVKDVLQVVNVHLANTFGDTLVDLDNLVDLLDYIVLHDLVHVLVNLLEDHLELLVGVLKETVDVDLLLVQVLFRPNHLAYSLVDLQLLVHFKVSKMLG